MSDAPRPSRRRANLVAVSVLVVALVGVLAWNRVSGDDTPARPSASATPSDGDSARERELAAQVRGLARAWDARDAARFDAAAGTSTRASAFADQTFAALTALDVRAVDLRLVATEPGDSADVVDAAVSVSWTPSARTGPARATDEAEVTFRFRRDDDRYDLESAAVGDGPLPLWLAGPVRVERVDDAEVVAVGASPTITGRVRTLVGDGVRTVTSTLPRASRDPVVVVPTSTAVAASLLGEETTSLSQLAAVTTTPDGRASTATGSVVVLNPEVFGRLDDRDARLVVTHELTHALSDVSADGVPLWVVEGFADWVALRDDDRSPREVAAQLLARVRSQGPPSELPTADEFSASADGLGATYEAAWLVFVVLQDVGDADDVVAFYEQVRDGADVDDALQRRFGIDQAQLLTRWQSYLRRQAG
ncbi:peptidase MA family metallohydrolase [Solicola sp. PLA-1-18]|uniref:peptidase MA family metallohydrolase n=1 Tax=Solicola sp. PLA-1-18 TaxID=3380532 RepID=UPI003B7D4F26